MLSKPIDPASTTTAVWANDPALSREGQPKLTLDELKRLIPNPALWPEFYKVKDGQEPTIFVLGTIPAAELDQFEDLHSEGSCRLYRARFVAGLRDIKNLGVEVPKVSRRGLEYVDPKWIDEAFNGPRRACAFEIGRYILSWNNHQEDDAKNS